MNSRPTGCRAPKLNLHFLLSSAALLLPLLLAGGSRAAEARSSDSPSERSVDLKGLAALVRAQAKEIRDLQTRLAAVEHGKGKPTPQSGHKSDDTHGGQAIRLASGAEPRGTRGSAAASPAVDTPPPSVVRAPRSPSDLALLEPPKRYGNETSINTYHVEYPIKRPLPGSMDAVSSMPSNASPVLGVESTIPSAARTTTVGGLVLKWTKASPEITTPDGQYSFHVRGRVLADWGDNFGSKFSALNQSRSTLRAARIGIEGRAKQLSWAFETDFSGNSVQVRSAYMTWSDKMAGHLVEYTLGNKFNERSFDGSSGSDQTVFLDRDLVATGILPITGWYGVGGAFKIFGEEWHVATQVMGNDVNSSNETNHLRDDLTFETRAHWIPWKSDHALLHIGAWGFYENAKPTASFAQSVTLLARTDNAFAARIDAPPLNTSYAGGVELFGIWRSAWLLGEYGYRHLDFRNLAGGGSAHTQAASLQTGWFLTGETPNYFAHTGVWSSPRVLRPMTDGGPGAIELAARLDFFDASDLRAGSKAWTATAGANWYFLSWARLMFNYTHAHVDNNAGPYVGVTGGNVAAVRAAVSF